MEFPKSMVFSLLGIRVIAIVLFAQNEGVMFVIQSPCHNRAKIVIIFLIDKIL